MQNWREDVFLALQEGRDHTYRGEEALRARGYGGLKISRRNETDGKILFELGFVVHEVMSLTGFSYVEAVALEEEVGEWPSYLLDMQAAGLTVQEISRASGVKRPTIYYQLRKRGLHPNVKRAPELTVRQYFQILDLADAEWTKADIARRLGVTYDQVRYALRQQQVA